jgi:hypothetical protein
MCFSQEILTHRLPGKDANMVDKSLTKTDVDLIFAKVVQILARFGRLVLSRISSRYSRDVYFPDKVTIAVPHPVESRGEFQLSNLSVGSTKYFVVTL